MERIAPMTSATAETPTWMVCLGFAIPVRVVGELLRPRTDGLRYTLEVVSSWFK
jgi:hypothetical protein